MYLPSIRAVDLHRFCEHCQKFEGQKEVKAQEIDTLKDVLNFVNIDI